MPHDSSQQTVTIERLVAGGDGLGRLADGRIIFVPATAPGDVVTVALVEQKRDLARGQVIAVEQPGPDRVSPPCPQVAAGCGGCDWQHLSIEGSRRAKVALTVDAFTRVGRISDAVERIRFAGPAGDPPLRTTVRVAIDRKGRAGFRRAGSHEVVPATDCAVVHPVLRDFMNNGRFEPGTEAQLRLGVAGAQAQIATPSADRVQVSDVPGWATSVVSPRSEDVVVESVRGVRLRVSPDAFFQSGPDAAEALVGAVDSLLPADARHAAVLVDLYGGVGLFAATLGPSYRESVLVEGSPAAVRDAHMNLGPDALVHRTDVDTWTPPRVVRRATAVHVVADPARSGLGRAGVATVMGCNPSAVVLVSCDAAAGARDARLLIEAGWALREALVLDLFPFTSHVEIASLFVPAAN